MMKEIGGDIVLTIPAGGDRRFETVLLDRESKQVIQKGELLLLSPDGEGRDDFYFLMGEGEVTVYRALREDEERAAAGIESGAAGGNAAGIESGAAEDNATVAETVAERDSAEGEHVRHKIQHSDVRAAMRIALTNFRWAVYLFKSVRNTYYDEQLTKAIKRIDRTFLLPLLFILGAAAACWFANEYMGQQWILPMLALWAAIDCVLINPFIYLIGLPKPIHLHIKNMEENENDGNIQWHESDRLEKLLKKYK